MTTPNTETGAITLRAMRAKLDEAAAIARAAEGCAVAGHPARAFVIALDIEPLAVEANRLLQGLAILSRVARESKMRYRAEPEPTEPFSGEYGFLKIRYKLPDDNTSRLVTTPITAAASADSAAAVAAFGQSCETTARQTRPR